jgi:hypothetical protein
MVDFGRRGVLGGLLGPLLGSLHLQASSDQANVVDSVHFDVPPDVYNGPPKETGAGSVGLSTLTLASVGGTGILGTLGDLGINRTVGQVVTTLVNPLLSALDAQVLGPLTDLLGVNVVGADIRALPEIECDDTLLQLVG